MVDLSRDTLITWSPSILLVLQVFFSLGAPGGPEAIVLLSLAGLQVAFLGVSALLWGKTVIESAAGVDE